MRKHKSVVAVLLAVMMIFTFMPTMAFAGTATTRSTAKSWAEDYSTVTDQDNDVFKTSRAFIGFNDVTQQTTGRRGLVTATAVDNSNTPVVGADQHLAPQGNNPNQPATAYFYDLTGSYLTYGGNAANNTLGTKLDGAQFTKAYFDANLNTIGAVLVEQSYGSRFAPEGTETYNDTNAKKVLVAFTKNQNGEYTENALRNVAVVIEVTGYDATVNTEQTVVFSVKSKTMGSSVTATSVLNESTPDCYGTIASATVTVKPDATTYQTAKFDLDAIGEYTAVTTGADESHATRLVGNYDGATHTLVGEDVSGYTRELAVYDSTTGRYNTVSEVTIKEVQKNDIKVRVRYTKNSTNYDRFLAVNLSKANVNTIGWDAEQSVSDTAGTYEYDVDGAEFDAADFIAVTHNEVVPASTASDGVKAAAKAKTAANKAAVAANKAEILAYFNEKYEIKTTPSKAVEDKYTLKVKAKDLTSAEEKAIEKKYEALFANISLATTEADTTTPATVYTNQGKWYEDNINITAISSVTYSGKKTTKAGTLKAKKTITVKAKADSGKKVSFKLVDAPSKITINKTTGKITVKKGLKKGTYKFYVKATTQRGDFYNAATEYHTIKVIVKK
jgi:hypothetical protein